MLDFQSSTVDAVAGGAARDGGQVLLLTDARGQFTAHDPLNNGAALLSFKPGVGAAPNSLVRLGGEAGPPLFQCAAGTGKPLLQTWWPGRPEELRHRQVLPGAVSALAVSADGRYLAAALADQVWLWQTASGQLVAMLSGPHNARVTQLIFTEPLTFLLSAGEDGVVAVWPLWRVLTAGGGGGQEVRPVHVWPAALCPVHIAVLGRAPHCAVLTAARSGAMTAYSALTGRRLLELVVEAQLHCLRSSACGRWAVAGSDQGCVVRADLVQDAETPASVPTLLELLEPADGAVLCVALSTLSGRMAAGAASGRVALATFPGMQRLCWLSAGSGGSPITNLCFAVGVLGDAALRGGAAAIEGQPAALRRQLEERPAEMFGVLLPERADDHVALADDEDVEFDAPLEVQESVAPNNSSNAAAVAVDSELLAALRTEVQQLRAANKRLHSLSVLAVLAASEGGATEPLDEEVVELQAPSGAVTPTADWQLRNSVHCKRPLGDVLKNQDSGKGTPRRANKRSKRGSAPNC